MPSKPLVDGARRTDLWYVDPNQIDLDLDSRGRWKGVPDEAIQRMAVSLLDDGQIQPVEVRRDGERILLSLGFTRTLAGRLIRQGFLDESGVCRQDKDFVLKVQLVNATAEQAFVRNIVENAVRNAVSPVDTAHNMDRLQDRYGYDNAKIAQVYGKSVRFVQKHLRLLTLEEKYQEMVHDGRLTLTAALELKRSDPSERDAVVAAAADPATGKVNGSAVVQVARRIEEAKEEANPELLSVDQRVTYRPRKLPELKMFLLEVEAVLPPAGKTLCRALSEFLEGKRSEKATVRTFFEVLDLK